MAVAALASSHNVKNLDPIDKVTFLTLKKYPRAREILQDGWTTEKYTPFDPVSKRITYVCVCGGIRYTRTVFGPPRSAAQLQKRPGRPEHYVINI
jgi:H+-transporting ATPase